MKINGSVLPIIPARGGSKRLPNKNILDFNGYPLIAWTIKAVIGQVNCEAPLVSTDDCNIASIAERYGAQVPFLRPSNLATDDASTVDVIMHLLLELRSRGHEYDWFLLLQPTSPLRDREDINRFLSHEWNRSMISAISVCEVDHSPLWSNTLPNDNCMRNFIKEEVKGMRSQDLPKYYRINGAMYLCRTKEFIENRTLLFDEHTFAFIMDRKHSIDIDTFEDFQYAEFLAREL